MATAGKTGCCARGGRAEVGGRELGPGDGDPRSQLMRHLAERRGT